MAARRGDEDDNHTWQLGQSSMMNDYHRQGQQQQYMQQYDAPGPEERGPSQRQPYQQQRQQRRELDDNARHSHYQQQPQNQSSYDNTYPDNYSKEQIDMQEVSRYPPSQQQYLNTASLPHGYSGSGNGNNASRAAVQGNGPAYAPAPVATASMADLRDSITNSTISADGGGPGATILPGKKPKRVYETAFGPFSWSDLLKRKYWKYYALLIVIGVAVLLAVIFHDDIIKWMQPIAEKIRDIKGGWAIWVGIMFVISFPPLFGHEVICLLCGLIYGLWWGFAIISLGTMLGEWGNFFVFKYWCSARSAKTEEKDVTYACICRVIREGGFRIAFMARLSALPGHLTTPAFAACGMSFWIFSITAFLTLPKQLMAVYLGTVFGQDNEGEKITTSKIVEWVVLGISFLITIWAAWYIYAKMAKWRPIVMEEQAANRLAAQEVLERDSRPVIATAYDGPSKSEIPRVTLSDEAGMIKSHSGRSNRLSAHRWPFHGQGHNRGSDGGSGASAARRMEEGSLGDLDGANSPLVADSAAPAGYSASRQHYQNSLYPASAGVSPYASSEEDIGYGYADGGEAYSVPYTASGRVDTSSSENVSMKWKPPQQQEDGALAQQQQNSNVQRQRSPAPLAQYNPVQYQQAYQTRSAAGGGPPSSYPNEHRDERSHQTSTLPSSLPQSTHGARSFPTPYRRPDVTVQDARSLPSHCPTPGSVPHSLRPSLPQQVSPSNTYLKSGPPLPQGALTHTEQRDRMHHQKHEDNQQTREEPASSYPDMINSRGGYPISQTQYHTGPPEQASTRYRSGPDPSRPSQYHTGQVDPDSVYRAAEPQQGSQYHPDQSPRYQ